MEFCAYFSAGLAGLNIYAIYLVDRVLSFDWDSDLFDFAGLG
jgi:hypothetical protein